MAPIIAFSLANIVIVSCFSFNDKITTMHHRQDKDVSPHSLSVACAVSERETDTQTLEHHLPLSPTPHKAARWVSS